MMILARLLITLAIITGGVLLFRKLKKQQTKKILAKTDGDAIVRIDKFKNEYWAGKPHISYREVSEWADGKLDGDFVDRKLAGEWRRHVEACNECREIIAFCREERYKKTIKELQEGLQN